MKMEPPDCYGGVGDLLFSHITGGHGITAWQEQTVSYANNQ